jgi:hypothetical protein
VLCCVLSIFVFAFTEKWDPQNKGEEIDTSLTSVWQGSIKQDEG